MGRWFTWDGGWLAGRVMFAQLSALPFLLPASPSASFSTTALCTPFSRSHPRVPCLPGSRLSSPLGSEMSDGNLPGKSSPSPSPCFGAERSMPCRDLILNSASPHPYLPEEVEAAICIFIKHRLAGYTHCIATSRSRGRPAGRQDRTISQRCITAP